VTLLREVVARVLGLATPESIILANFVDYFQGNRTIPTFKPGKDIVSQENDQKSIKNPFRPVLGAFSEFVRFLTIFAKFWPFPYFN
jgi:hypothetical protein